MTRVGIISDTHGMLRPQVVEKLQGCDRILHAGDVGSLDILNALSAIAPVEAVRGNTDTQEGMCSLPHLFSGVISGLPFQMVHRRQDIDPAWIPRSRLIIFGHSHRPEMEWKGNCLLLNPGAVGARRFKLPLTLAVVRFADDRILPEIHTVE